MSDAALAFSNWTESEARERIRRLLAQGWSASSIALMFGIDIGEINRLAGEPRTMAEVSA
jgi:hypothetical protein